MSKYLITNADDFGFAKEINRGIIDAHVHGTLTSTSLMVNEPFAADAAELAKKYPGLGVGLHFTSTNANGEFFDLDDAEIVKKELESQHKKFCELMGKQPTHIDSHHHVHTRDNIKQLFIPWAEKHKLPLRMTCNVFYNGGFYGQWYDENMNPFPCHECISIGHFESMLNNLQEGITEFGCHPGYIASDLKDTYLFEREVELSVLLNPDLLQLIHKKDIKLINFAELPDLRR